MSLESNLELNNQLLTQHNALLERLISTLASGVVMRPDAIAQVQEYREEVSGDQPTLTLDDLEFGDIIALAAFCPVAKPITEEMLQRAVAYRDATGEAREARVVQIDALDSALQGVKRAKELLKPSLLDLSRNILKFWDDLPTIGERRAFAEQLLDVPGGERAAMKPKKASSKERKGPFYWKYAAGDSFGMVDDLGALNEILEDELTVEINKVEYLQLKEEAEKASAKPDADQPDFEALRLEAKELILKLAKGGYREEAKTILGNFGGTKLGEVADENLADVIAQAEKALEG
ncbi:hypothetical protein [Citrobacter koseri]|uniref:hypothetical protein n=1 Tax=Citrobacter koseri TaxID=545 RepID=UPI0023AFD3AB|nr:hypothetical protein [Citrobacter koseri]